MNGDDHKFIFFTNILELLRNRLILIKNKYLKDLRSKTYIKAFINFYLEIDLNTY